MYIYNPALESETEDPGSSLSLQAPCSVRDYVLKKILQNGQGKHLTLTVDFSSPYVHTCIYTHVLTH